MENKEIPSAEEFFAGEFQNIVLKEKCNKIIEFAKLHVQAALEAATENADVYPNKSHENGHPMINKDSILNAYPENNIK